MTPSTPVQDLATQWKFACRLYPIYFELAREFAIDVQASPDLEAGVETPGKEAVEQANRWLEEMDQRIQVHQLRQFLQTNSAVNADAILRRPMRFATRLIFCSYSISANLRRQAWTTRTSISPTSRSRWSPFWAKWS